MTERDFAVGVVGVWLGLQFFTVVAWVAHGLAAAALVFIAMLVAFTLGAGVGITGIKHGFYEKEIHHESRRKR